METCLFSAMCDTQVVVTTLDANYLAPEIPTSSGSLRFVVLLSACCGLCVLCCDALRSSVRKLQHPFLTRGIAHIRIYNM